MRQVSFDDIPGGNKVIEIFTDLNILPGDFFPDVSNPHVSHFTVGLVNIRDPEIG